MQDDGQDMIGPFKETRSDEANECKKNVTLYASISLMQIQSTPVVVVVVVGGRGRNARQ